MRVLNLTAVAPVVLLGVVFAGSSHAAERPGAPPALMAGAAGIYTPPPCQGLFADVPCTAQFAAWVEQFYRDGITSGCSTGNYCPDSPVTRRQMAVFVERAMRGSAAWPPRIMNVYSRRGTDGSQDEVGSGDDLRAALAAIPTTGPDMPSEANPWILKIGPGVYDLGTAGLDMRPFVDVEGAGQSATRLLGIGDASRLDAYVVKTANHAELRDLTVVSTAGEYSVAVAVVSTAARLTRVTAGALGADTDWATAVSARAALATSVTDCRLIASSGLASGLSFLTETGATLDLRDCEIAVSAETMAVGVGASGGPATASGLRIAVSGPPGNAVGFYVEAGQSVLTDSTIASPTAVVLYGLDDSNTSGLHVRNCSFDSAGPTIVVNTFAAVRVGGSHLAGGPVTTSGTGTAACAGVWDESYVFYPNTCP